MAKKKYKIPEDEYQIIQEPSVAYGAQNYYQLAYSGISKSYLKYVLNLSHLSVNELINIIPISIDTYKRSNDFKPPVTEKVLEIEEVYKKGLEAFGNDFFLWMDTINPALGNIKPKQLLANSFGIRMLLDEIGRLEHGILA